ncbi:zinc finger protein 883-like isoform X1 [Culex pipiens pallens]|uniref:zinc finger protein 883-like isoform X1 n=1 Tax=Culex pipiens pallens TaxID=42434 RepID=UPI00195319D0|nr:zinc finger protein 883-like isoform X1 [Culex pipiens pallens]
MAESKPFSAVAKQEHVDVEDPSAFCYETLVKEELIIEDELEPSPEKDDGQDQTEVLQNQSAGQPSNTEWHCEKCNQSYPTSKSFSAHKTRHKALETGRFACQQCERRFPDNNAQRRHKCKGKATGNPVSWVCEECNRTFPNRHIFYLHKYRHRVVKEARYRCELCDKCFSDKNAQTKHVQNVHREKRSIKAIQLKSEDERDSKAEEKDENGLFKCPDCDKRFEVRNSYTSHLRQHLAMKQERYKCKICELSFRTSSELKRHDRAHENHKSKLSNDPFASICPEATMKEENGIFKCSACEKTFEQRRAALRHLMRHGYVKRDRVQCKLCPMLQTFVNKTYLEKHRVEHESSKDVSASGSSSEKESDSDDLSQDGASEFKCTDCNKTFREKRLLNRHIRRHEAIKESKFPCKLCDVRCGSKRELITHEEMHARKQQTTIVSTEKVPPIILERNNHTVYKCPDCALIFTKQRVYSTHALRHVNVKNGTFKCETCGVCCPTRRNQLEHIRKHRAGKVIAPTQQDNFPFECPECGKKFPLRKYLIQHVRRHEAVESGTFQCKICAKFFSTGVELARHEKIHEGKDKLEKFKCSECGFICASRSSFVWHLKRHEAIRSGKFECKVCGKKMGSKHELEVHTRRHPAK